MTRPGTVFLAIVLCAAAIGQSPADDETMALLTRGGGAIDSGGLAPGLIDLVAESSFAVLKDSSGRTLAAGGTTGTSEGAGRVVAFAHDGFLKSPELLSQASARELIFNAIRWCGCSDKPEVAIHPELEGLASALETAGFRVVRVAPTEVSRHTVEAVYVTVAQRGLDDEAVSAVLQRVQQGGGLVLAATPWPFGKDYPNFADFPANRLAGAAGIRFKSEGTATRGDPFPVAHADSAAVLATLRSLLEGATPALHSERAALAETLKSGASLRGAALVEFLEGLLELNHKLGPIVPTSEAPLVPGSDPLVDVIVALENEFNQTLPAGAMYAIPAAADYPGETPDKAVRTVKTLDIDGTWRGWLSGRGAAAWAAKEMRPTGLYAAPGEVVTVTAPTEIAGRGFEVVIGAYAGGLDNREKWHRYPRIQRAVAIDAAETKASNALGGLVTVRVPRDADFGTLRLTISGAIDAPLFVAGRTDLREWRERIRRDPAPWAELVSDRIILALPSRYVRGLDDPDKVLAAWDEIIEKSAELCGGVDRSRYRAERIVFERQPSAGYMHSGYPVAAPQDRSVEQAVDARSLRAEGNWGFFHEYGHNHQHDLWALPGTGETTCNLWSVYLFEEWVGKSRAEGHDAIRPLDRRQRLAAYVEGGRNFERDWSVWTALETYLQIQETFGWDPFKRVFAEYNALPESEWPRSQQERNDQWVIRLSRACGKNLAPFWQAWRLPLSEAVAGELEDLPAWEDHPAVGWDG